MKKYISIIAAVLLSVSISATVSAQDDGSQSYKIKQGDTLSQIANDHGITIKRIKARNPEITDANMIRAGKVIHIPQKPQKPSHNNYGDNGKGSQNQGNNDYNGNNSSNNNSVSKANFKSQEQQVINLVNMERKRQGLQPVKADRELTEMARDKSQDMAENHYFAHHSPKYGSPFDMMQLYNIHYTAAGENIAKGQQTPQIVMNSWMNSQGHRENIMNGNYNRIGVGVVKSDGVKYWTQEFVSR